jgi:cell wall assembly regulator SMI1
MTARGPDILDEELLGELKERWRRQGAPIASRLRPGRQDGSFDAVTEPLGLRVPAEARTWWSWHDGATTDGFRISWMLIGTGWSFYSLDDAVAEAVEQRQRATEVARSTKLDPSAVWNWDWLPISTDTHGGVIVVDGARQLEGATPVYYFEPEDGGGPRPVAAHSFGQMIRWWIEALDKGWTGWDPTSKAWAYDPYKIDPAIERTRLV